MSKNENNKMTKQKIKQTDKLVYDKGMNDLEDPIRKDGKSLKFYNIWKSMLQRCYSEKSLSKHRTYRGCTVCPNWLSLSNFKEWFEANYRDGMELDKDILIPSNKIYSSDTCRFVPHYINSLLCDSGAARGELPLGVTALKPNPKTGRIAYKAQCCDGKGGRPSETFKTIPEAVAWYSTKKKEVVKEIVLESFWRNEIMSDVATALLEREW